MEPKTQIDFVVPTCWRNLSDKELKHLYQLIADNFTIDEIKLLCLFRWSGTTVIGRQDNGSYLLKKGKLFFQATSTNTRSMFYIIGERYLCKKSRDLHGKRNVAVT